ncbi:MAG: shikimate kinase [Christensenellaceae bacterium]|nr:shikimate kinase [Christensenellaceae bacterium]
MNIYLVGMMGCGKTTLGRALAKKLGLSFVDLDAALEQRVKKSIPQIFSEQGEEGFRQAETENLKYYAQKKGIVAGCGGGIVLRQENVQLMRGSGKVVFLCRPPEEILKTLDVSGRPVLRDHPEEFFAVYEKRLPLYEKAADILFDNSGSVAEAAEKLAGLLHTKG